MYTSEEDSLSYLPDPPDKPLPTDCCGTGCTPCVMDIYQKELESWQSLEAMTPTERATQRREMLGGQRRRDASVRRALSTTEFRSFVVRAIERVTMDTCVYTIALPDSSCLDYLPGQHCMLRYMHTVVLLWTTYTHSQQMKTGLQHTISCRVFMGFHCNWINRNWNYGLSKHVLFAYCI